MSEYYDFAFMIRHTAELCRGFLTEKDMNPKQQKNLKRAVKKWAKQAANETILAWAWEANWMGDYNGSGGILVTDQAIYCRTASNNNYYPFKGLYKVSKTWTGFVTMFYQDGTEKHALLNGDFLEGVVSILEVAARVNLDYLLEQRRENRKKYRVCAHRDFYQHIYRFKDSEFAVLCEQHDTDDWNKIYFLFREIHEGESGRFQMDGAIIDTADGFFSPHKITFISSRPFSWMEKNPYSNRYYYSEERNTDFLFEMVGDVVCASYPGGAVCVYEGKRFPFSPERGTKTELAMLVPGDNVYVYIDEKQMAHIVYSVHTDICGRNRSYPINDSGYGSVDEFYEKAFEGYDIDEYELLSEAEEAYKWYKI